MASYTTNLNLKKPAGSENVAIGDINNNMDTIDQAYGTLNSKIISGSKTITAQSGATGSETIYLPYTDANYSVAISIKYAANFTKAYPYYDRKYAGYVDIGFYNDHSSSLTLDVDYIISKY